MAIGGEVFIVGEQVERLELGQEASGGILVLAQVVLNVRVLSFGDLEDVLELFLALWLALLPSSSSHLTAQLRRARFRLWLHLDGHGGGGSALDAGH